MDLTLKKECRDKLKKPLGKLVNERDLLREIKSAFKKGRHPKQGNWSIKNEELITVGDKVTQTILELNLKPKLAIVDYKIERKKTEYSYRDKFEEVIMAKNKAGTISSQAIEKIKESLKYKNCLLEIEGEEDLLTLPVILEMKKGLVCYGQPKEGIVVVKVDKKKKLEIKELLKKCFTH